jgi:LuxR family maltose regulon positive regulatory protein
VFLTEADGHTWYRYHSLFATLLQARLHLHQPDLADNLHQRAAAWFLDEDMPVEAEAHARAAGDWALLSRLARRRWVERTLAGEDSSDGLLARVPPTALTGNEALALLAAAEACTRLDRAAADTFRETAHELAASAPLRPAGPDEPAVVDATPPQARALLDIAYARAFGADARARTAVSTLRSTVPSLDVDADVDADAARLADLRSIGLDLDEGDTQRARANAAALAVTAGSTWIGAEAFALQAIVEAVEAELDLAHRHGKLVLATAASWPVARHVASLAIALCHALRGEQRQALDSLGDAGALHLPDAWLRGVDGAVRAGVRAPGTALGGLDVGDAARPVVKRALVALGVLEAVDTTGRVHPTGGPVEASVVLARQRWRVHDAAGVLSVLGYAGGTGVLSVLGDSGGGQSTGPGTGHARTAIERDALVALAVAHLGDRAATEQALDRVLDGVATSGIWAPLLALGPDLAAPLEIHPPDLGRHHGLALQLIERFHQSPGPAFVAPLTTRETALLRLLPALMTYNDIAGNLHISVNTVKTHLKSLYRKLGVASRREAVQRGRALELL